MEMKKEGKWQRFI